MERPKTLLVVKMDGDGDCLFHALAYHLGAAETGAALRDQVANYMEQEALEQPSWESEYFLEEARSLRAGVWGGTTASTVFTKMMGVRVVVHTKEADKDVAVKDWTHLSVPDNRTTLHLLFNGSDHYDALKEVEYQANAMEAAWEQPPPPAYAASIIESEAFPALHAEVGPAVRNKRQVGFTAPRPSKKGKAKARASKKPALKTETSAAAEDEMDEATGREEDSDSEKGRNQLLEQLQAIPVAETSLHPHRQAEDLTKAGVVCTVELLRSCRSCLMQDKNYFYRRQNHQPGR